MKTLLLTAAALAGIVQCLPAASFQDLPDLGKHFQKHGVTGTFVLYDPATDTIYGYNPARARERFVPASTFKIANTLIGLDCGAVSSVDEVLPYGGTPQPVKEWEKDMSLREAIGISNVPVYQNLARRIGLERMSEGVKKLNYGNEEIGTVVDRFWLDGPLAISAVEQTDFLFRLTHGKLPVSAEAVKAVREITRQETTGSSELHGKTGWATSATPQIGWWVGWVEKDGKIYPFALNIDMTGEADAPKRMLIGKECLKALGKIT